jgi:hypothetical protein
MTANVSSWSERKRNLAAVGFSLNVKRLSTKRYIRREHSIVNGNLMAEMRIY